MARHFLSRDRWDVFAVAFGDSHCAGHQFWFLHDPAHPKHDPHLAAEIGDPLRDVYAAIDAGIGRILEAAGPGTRVIVLASHGMGPHYDGTFLLDEVLRRLEAGPRAGASSGGLREPRGEARAGAGDRTPRERVSPVERLRSVWHRMPPAVRARFMPLADGFYDAWQARQRASQRFFVVPTNDNCAGIRVSLLGREPRGRVRPGVEYEDLCRSLAADLAEIVNVETGRPLVREVLRSAEAFPGEHSAALPDLLVRWNREAPVRTVRSPKIGTIEREYRGIRSGDHRNPGMFFARGPGIAPGRRDEPVDVVDFAPTLAALLGVEMPGVDGRAIAELCG
jgi:predicted AlkP superfamily phosphohydrolase/phosphomutase